MTSRLVFIAASAALTLSGCSSANSAMDKKRLKTRLSRQQKKLLL